MIRHVSLKWGDLEQNCISGAFCLCVYVRYSSDTRGVHGNPGFLPLFMVDGSEFSM